MSSRTSPRVPARIPRVLVLAAAIGLTAAACGSSKNTGTAAGGIQSATTTTSPSAATTGPATTAAGGGSATVSTASTKLGTVLVNSAGKTLYYLDKDTATTFGCTGGCTSAWPPLTVSSGSTPMAGSGVTGTLAVRARPDGSQQVTWNGHPLYSYVGDQAAGDTMGDGVGGVWHAAKAGAASTSATSGGGSYGYP